MASDADIAEKDHLWMGTIQPPPDTHHRKYTPWHFSR